MRVVDAVCFFVFKHRNRFTDFSVLQARIVLQFVNHYYSLSAASKQSRLIISASRIVYSRLHQESQS